MIVSFFCKKCDLDQDLPGYVRSNSYGEWFESKCRRCSKKMLRYITEKHKDPYFYDSLKLKRQRIEAGDDLLQPGQPRFKTLYKDEYDRIEKAKEDYENEIKKRKERIVRYQKDLVDSYDKKEVGKVLEKHLLDAG